MQNESTHELNARNIVHKFIVTMKKHKNLFTKMREKTGLGRSAHRLLMILSDSDDTPSQIYLAERLEISTAAVAVMLKKMESDGFIERKTNTEDSRFNSIELTEKGADIISKSKEAFSAIDTAMFNGFSEEELMILNGFLDRLQSNIKAFEEGDII